MGNIDDRNTFYNKERYSPQEGYDNRDRFYDRLDDRDNWNRERYNERDRYGWKLGGAGGSRAKAAAGRGKARVEGVLAKAAGGEGRTPLFSLMRFIIERYW